MKVWGTLLYNGCQQWRSIVAAKSQKDAAAAFGISTHQLRNWGSETGNDVEVRTALGKPGVVFWRPARDNRYDGYVERDKV